MLFKTSVALICFAASSMSAAIDFDPFYDGGELIAESPSVQNPKQTTTSSKTPSSNHEPYVALGGEALILNCGLNNLEYGDRVKFKDDVEYHTLQSLSRSYNVGVRGDLEVIFHALDWGIKAQGFHYGATNTTTLKGNPSYYMYLTYSSNLNDTDPFNTLTGSSLMGRQKGEYLLNLNMGDLLMTKKLVHQKHFTFALDAGFRYFNASQQLNVYNYNLQNNLANTIKNQDKFSAYGLLVRFHNMFYFARSLALDLSVAGGCVYGSQSLKNSSIGNTMSYSGFVGTMGSGFYQNNHKVQSMVEFEAKLKFEKSCFDDSVTFLVTAGYFLMDIFNSFDGIKIASVAFDQIETTSRYQADLVLQGATAGFGIKF